MTVTVIAVFMLRFQQLPMLSGRNGFNPLAPFCSQCTAKPHHPARCGADGMAIDQHAPREKVFAAPLREKSQNPTWPIEFHTLRLDFCMYPV
jgi:hypothetical protein